MQRAVANALGLPPDDEELNSVDQMLEDNSAQTPIAWIRGCAKNGDLGRLLNAVHAASWAMQEKAAEANRARAASGRGLVWLVGMDGNTNPINPEEAETLDRMLARRREAVGVPLADRMPAGAPDPYNDGTRRR